MASITNTLGVGSGLDISSLVSGLVSASYDPKLEAQKTKEDANTAKISALGTLTGNLTAFSSALNTLVSSGTLKTQPTTSDASVVTAKTKAGMNISTIAEQIEVRQIAKAQSVVSGYAASANAPVGTGTLTLTVAGTPKTITIDGTNNSLAGLAKAINDSKAGVTATVVTDANGARLSIKGATGAANGFTLTAAADADPALQAYTYGDGDDEMTLAQAATDAIVRKDGVDFTAKTNSFDDLIPGISLSLVSAKPGTSIAIGSSRPTEAITQAVNDFVAAYNELKTQLNDATKAGSGGSTAGALYGHAAVRTVERQLAQLVATKLQAGDGPQTLAEIGVSTTRDGTLTVNAGKLASTLAAYPDAVEAMFNPQQRSSNPLVTITSAIGAAKPGTYTVTNLVAAPEGGNASGTIDGRAGLPASDGRLYASSLTGAAGLIIRPTGSVASATITIDLGIGGALEAITKSLTKSGGVLKSLGDQLGDAKSRLADARLKLEAAQTAYKDQLTTSFTRMESRVTAFKATQSYLTQQIAMWTNQN
jgi:flagellar hook-associated protein 2